MSFADQRTDIHLTNRVMIFIDAGSIRINLRNIFHDDWLNYRDFIESIKTHLSIPYVFFDIIRIYYYDATPEFFGRTSTMNRKYIQLIKDTPGFEDRLGIIKRAKKKEPRQKGVDTQIAVDMLSKAYENQYDIAILVAGDEDFLPIVDAVKSAGKRVYGAYFESHVSQELKESFDNSLILNKEWFINQSLKGKVVHEKFRIHSNYNMMGKMHASITITTVKAALHLLLIDKDGKERDIEFCGLAKYNAGEPKTIDLKLNTEVDKNDWERQSIILYVKDDKGIFAYRGMDLCSLACCQALGGVLGC